MTTFNYTHYKRVDDSSLVRQVAYNQHSRQLVVDLNGSLYLYNDATGAEYAAIANARSKGAAYNDFQNSHPTLSLRLGDDVTFQFGLSDTAKAAQEDVAKSAEAVADSDRALDVTQATIFELRPAVVAPVATVVEAKRSHTVYFTLGDNPKEFGYNVEGATVDEAIAAISEVGAALDQAFVATKVVTYLV